MNPRASTVALAVILLVLLAPLVPDAGGPPALAGGAPGTPVATSSVSGGGAQPLAALLSFGLTASTSQADPKETVAFTVYFNNTGTQAAPQAWINVTASSSLTFLGDTAVGNVSGYPDYLFSGVPLGLHSFRMSFLVNVGTAPGSRLAVAATLVYSDGTGGQQFLGPASASVLVGIVTKPLYLASSLLPPGILTPVTPTGASPGTFTLARGASVNFDLTPALARPFRALNASAVLYLQPVTPPATLDLNLTLIDVNGGSSAAVARVEQSTTITGSGYWFPTYTFPAMNYLFSAGHQIRLQVLNTLNSGQSAILATNATAEPSRLNLQTSTYVSIDSLQPSLSPMTYLSPKSSLVVTANVSDPFGSSEIIAAHVNVTGPSGALMGWSDPFPVVAVDPSSPSAWKLFRTTLSPLLQNGTYSVEVTAVERNGVTDLADGGAVVRAPDFTLQKVASPTQGKSGTRITYSVWYNNTGTGPAGRVWLNDTLPSQVNFLSSVPAPTSSSGNALFWVFSSVPVGNQLVQITAQVKGGVSGVSYIRNWASLNYTDGSGFLWPAVRSHADVVLNGPFFQLTQVTLPAATLHSNQAVVYTITLTNTGDAANTVWMNDTLASGLAYSGDTAGSHGGTRVVLGNQVDWTFSNIPSGAVTPYSLTFTMSARAAAGLPWGTRLPNTIGLNDTSANGILMPDQVSVLSLTIASPAITAAGASFGVPTAVPRVNLPVYVNITNGGNEAAGSTWVNLTLDPSLRFVSSAATATVVGSVLQLTLANVSLGADSVLVFLAASPSVTDGLVLSVSGSLQATDGYGNLLAPVAVLTGTVTVALPNVRLGLSPANVTAEAGTPIAYRLTGGNTGSGTASIVWMNVTLPADLVYVDDAFGASRTVLGANYSWMWQGYAPGQRTYTLTLAAAGAAADRSSTNVTFTVQALDLGGNPQAASSFSGRVNFLAPSIAVSVWASNNQTLAGGTLTYTLRAENVGSTTALTLWLTVHIDSHLNVISYDAAVPATGTTKLNWTFQGVAPGQTIVITLFVKVAEGTPGNTDISDTLVAQYTNSAGTILGYAPPASSRIRVVPDLLPLAIILGGGSAVGALVIFLVYRRYRVRIEDVFLIYRDGILVSHLTQGDGLEKDEDQLSGMLTAVQDFVKDAFTYGEHRELHQLEFGDYHVLIERGKVVHLAVVYQGRDSGLIRKKVRAVLDKVETSFGAVFDAWDGDMGQVEGTRELLREGFLETKRPWSLVKSKPT